VSDPKPTVAVLKGGRSAERDISLVTGGQVEEGLREAGFSIVSIDTGEADFFDRIRECGADVAFVCLHGRFGEDGTIQGLLELIDMPYVGCGVLSSALAMDKAMSKAVFVARGVPTPEHVCVRTGDPVDIEELTGIIGERSVVKPVCEGSAIGVTIVHSVEELPAALEEAFLYDDDVLVEGFVEGVEVTVGVLGTGASAEALPTLEIVPEHEFYDFVSKYEPGMSQHIIPARISDAAQEACARIALQAHRVLQCRGMSRVDLIVAPGDDVYVLEVNTIPGMTPTSLLPDAARAAGIEFPQLCERLVSDALSEGPAPACG
jgi:D-alanine-D-alanine ligase